MIYCRTLRYAQHIFSRHPEVDVSDIDECVRNPDECYIDNTTYYYILTKKLNDIWICCVVDKLNNECIVASAWYMNDRRKTRYVSGKLARGEWSIV